MRASTGRGVLNSTFAAGVVGVGAGRGIALIFIISALSLWISSTYAYANPRIRNLGMQLRMGRMRMISSS